ncbi:MAG: molecular chaperone DnaJ [Shinella sp.]|nr:MAG: molecular chaperone DnaJ [Shinella sp.]
MRDLYSVLGVKHDAGAEEIKAAWRTRAKSVHPDQNRNDPNANQRFAEIGRAYEVLKDPKKRNQYDQQLSKVEAMEREQTIMQQRETAREAARQAAEKAKAAKANAERIMAELAKAEAEKNRTEKVAQSTAQAAQAAAAQAAQAKAAQTPPPGQSSAASGAASSGQAKTAPAGETPEEMVSRIFGDTPEAVAAAENLKRENESKAEKADKTEKPESADAAAAAAAKPASIFAPVELISSLVRRFRGTQPAPEKAPDLHVEANVTIEDLLAQKSVPVTLADGRELRVPLSGVSEGHVVQLKAQGHKLPNMARGDVYATIRVQKDEKFRVDGFDIRTVLPITLENAVLGCEMQVETPAGPVDITIPAWSNSDQVISLEGQGLPDDAGGRGAVLVELRVKLWEKPDDKVTDLMRVMREGLFL